MRERIIRWRRKLPRILSIVFYVWLIFVGCLIGLITTYGQRIPDENADVIVVLGAGLRRSGQPGPALRRRSALAADLWAAGKAPYVLCTGGQASGYPRSEAAACGEILESLNVPADRIVLEEKSRSTEENALYTQQIMTVWGWNSAIVVSDSYHILRAEWIFNNTGIEVVVAGVPPDSMPISSFVQSVAREVVAFHWQVFKVVFNLPVTYVPVL